MSTSSQGLPRWTLWAPLAAWLILGLTRIVHAEGIAIAMVGVALVGSVFAAVHHAGVVAHRVGEPFGTLVLAIAVTVIEVALIARSCGLTCSRRSRIEWRAPRKLRVCARASSIVHRLSSI